MPACPNNPTSTRPPASKSFTEQASTPTGRQTGRTAVGTEAGVGIGAPPAGYPYPSSSTGPNVGAIEQELWEKSLPDGKTSVPVAGYLYFPRPSGRADGLELAMDGHEGRLRLILPKL